MDQPLAVRRPGDDEIDALADLWHLAWRDAHEAVVPPQLTALRTRDSLVPRLRAALDGLRVVGPVGAPLGFCIVQGEELYQLFVAREGRGTGVAAVLMADAEVRLRARGVRTAWLSCAIGNERAACFYEKHGWRRTGAVVETLSTAAGPFDLEVWRYEKDLGASPAGG